MKICKSLIAQFVKSEIVEYRKNTLTKDKEDIYDNYQETYVFNALAQYFASVDFDKNGWDNDGKQKLFLHVLYQLGNCGSILHTLYRSYLHDEYAEVYCLDEISDLIEYYCEGHLRSSKEVSSNSNNSFYAYIAHPLCDCNRCQEDGVNALFEHGVYFSSLEELKEAFQSTNIDIVEETFEGIQKILDDTYDGYIEIVDIRNPQTTLVVEEKQ